MAKRIVQVKQSGAVSSASPKWIGMMWLLLVGFAPLAAAGDRGFEAGIRCLTRMQSREVAARQFVVEPVTFCMRVSGCGLRHARLGQVMALSSTRTDRISDGAMSTVMHTHAEKTSEIPSGRAFGGIEAQPSAAQIPRWSQGRRRLSNAQYASSVRELRGMIRPTTR